MVTETTTVTRPGIGFDLRTMTPVHWVAGALSAVTGTIHIYLYAEQGFLPFLFAGVVFYAAVLGLLLNTYRRVLYALGIPFTAGQIGLWIVQGLPDFEIGVADKVVQVVLIAVLAYLFVNERRLVDERLSARVVESDGDFEST